MDERIITAVILLASLCILAFVGDYENEVEDLLSQIDSLTAVCDSLQRDLAVDTLFYSSEVIVFEGAVEVHSPIIFEQPVTFDSTVIFKDSVSFGYGGVSFVEPPLAVYD